VLNCDSEQVRLRSGMATLYSPTTDPSLIPPYPTGTVFPRPQGYHRYLRTQRVL